MVVNGLLLAAVLLGGTRAAGSDGDISKILCKGQPVEAVNAALEKTGRVQLDHELTTCGGGISDTGQKVETYPCFTQTWQVEGSASAKGTLHIIYTKYLVWPDEWRLLSAAVLTDPGHRYIRLGVCQ